MVTYWNKILLPRRDNPVEYAKKVNHCQHRYTLFNAFHNLYYCEWCDSYWIPLKKLKHGYTKMGYAHVDFSTEDDRIVNIFCPALLKMLATYERKHKHRKIKILEPSIQNEKNIQE